MQFDARAAKLLTPGAHIMVDGCQGLRLEASASKRSWIYRFKSPVDGRMRQKKIGEWPAVSLAKAAVAWEALRDQRNAGTDPVLETRATAGRSRRLHADRAAAGGGGRHGLVFRAAAVAAPDGLPPST